MNKPKMGPEKNCEYENLKSTNKTDEKWKS